MRSLTFGFSPCPNDTFAFHALVHGLVDAPFAVEPVLLDIEELNRRAHAGELDLTKLSFGAARRRRRPLPPAPERRRARARRRAARRRARAAAARRMRAIAIPGRETTAYPAASPRRAGARRRGRAALRPDPRSGRARRGRRGPDHPREPVHVRRPRARRGRRSRRVVGARDRAAGAAGRDLRPRRRRRATPSAVEAAIRASVEYAFAHPEASRDYVRAHSQELSDEVCDAHIALYVNEFSVDLGDAGAGRDRAARGAAALAPRLAAVPRAVILSAVRTPVGRYGGGLAGGAAGRSRGDGDRGGGRARRRAPRARSRTSGSAAPTRPARTTATSRGWRALLAGLPRVGRGRDRQPALRLGPVGGRRRVPRGRSPGTATCSSPAASSR